ncbi:hypothetical protein BB560_002884 [Smittium megazygosporum]|uniref:Metallo-beta-lactamase domain-containing protein n=1 Tax=Smittium megazygosporum TaxID=133381 RepID=A0A2T9ZDP0_9FUNG|nr:hypothetical protein BB560_002884 [Smittium megazygosporum]
MKIYLNSEAFDVIKTTFPYIVDTRLSTGGGEVPTIEFKIIDEDTSIDIFGVNFSPLKVEHGLVFSGNPYYCFGYRFENISYVSDCNLIPEKTKEKIKGSSCFIVDALRWTPHLSHFSFDQALEEILIYRPKLSLLTDFCHRIDHFEMESTLKEWEKVHRLSVHPSFDGLVVNVDNDSYELV